MRSEETLGSSLKGALGLVPPSKELSILLKGLPSQLINLYHSLPETAPSADTDPEGAFALHSLLTALDPDVGARWHWKDTRKVLRSLEIIRETGRLNSTAIASQAREVLLPRYRTLCFWLYAHPDILNPRLDSRVDQMIK